MKAPRPTDRKGARPIRFVLCCHADVQEQQDGESPVSVAFRRDSDEEHKEPRFELPLPPGPNLVTKRGYDQIQARTAELEAAVSAASSADQGAVLQRDLRYWRARLATARVAPRPSGETIAFGTRVTIHQDGRTRTLTIVGHDEADPASGLIAFASPLAQALMGAEAGEDVAVPGRDDTIRVIAITPA
jgi:transcription elongation GreA/GreB family factor